MAAIVARGIDEFWWAFDSPAETRIAFQLRSLGYVVNSVSVERGFFSRDLLITIDAQPSGTVESFRQAISHAIELATGNAAGSIAINGDRTVDPVPSPESAGRFVGGVADALNVGVDTAKLLILAIGIAGVIVVIELAQHPDKARRTLGI